MAVTTQTQALWFQSYVQTMLASMLDEELERDADGDFEVRGATSRGWLRVETVEPWGVRIFAYAAHYVPVKAATLREINAVNGAEPLVKLFLDGDGSVLVSHCLLADALTPGNLNEAVSLVLNVADRVGALLVAVHGGQTPIFADPESDVETDDPEMIDIEEP